VGHPICLRCDWLSVRCHSAELYAQESDSL